MAAAVGSRVLPGERVGLAERLVAGRGTYVNGTHVYASVVGLVEIAASAADGETVRRSFLLAAAADACTPTRCVAAGAFP
jgi:hypothetical protein